MNTFPSSSSSFPDSTSSNSDVDMNSMQTLQPAMIRAYSTPSATRHYRGTHDSTSTSTSTSTHIAVDNDNETSDSYMEVMNNENAKKQYTSCRIDNEKVMEIIWNALFSRIHHDELISAAEICGIVQHSSTIFQQYTVKYKENAELHFFGDIHRLLRKMARTNYTKNDCTLIMENNQYALSHSSSASSSSSSASDITNTTFVAPSVSHSTEVVVVEDDDDNETKDTELPAWRVLYDILMDRISEQVSYDEITEKASVVLKRRYKNWVKDDGEKTAKIRIFHHMERPTLQYVTDRKGRLQRLLEEQKLELVKDKENEWMMLRPIENKQSDMKQNHTKTKTKTKFKSRGKKQDSSICSKEKQTAAPVVMRSSKRKRSEKKVKQNENSSIALLPSFPTVQLSVAPTTLVGQTASTTQIAPVTPTTPVTQTAPTTQTAPIAPPALSLSLTSLSSSASSASSASPRFAAVMRSLGTFLHDISVLLDENTNHSA